jgi:hypothetical protein
MDNDWDHAAWASMGIAGYVEITNFGPVTIDIAGSICLSSRLLSDNSLIHKPASNETLKVLD